MQLEASIPSSPYVEETPAAGIVRASASQVDSLSISRTEVYGLTRGVVAGFFFESVTILAILGIWEIWRHLFR